jgi:signal transduction histidine kinase
MSKRKENKILHQLISTIGELNASFERKDISQVVVEGLCNIFSLEKSFFYSIDESRTYLTLEAQKNDGGEREKIPVGYGAIGWVAKNGEVLIFSEKSSKNKFVHFIASPVRGKKGILGVIGGKRSGKKDFDEIDKEYIKFFGSQVGAVMENYIYYHRLRRSKEFRDTILYNVPSGIIVLNPDWKIKTYNISAVSILGDEGLKNKEIYKVFKDEVFINSIKKAFSEGKPTHNLEIIWKERYLNISIVPMKNEENDNFDLLFVLDDITELKKAYEEKERSSRLSYLGQFVAGVAHELRNPLTGINIALEMVKEDPTTSEKNKKTLENVLKEIANLEEMLASLLEISKPMNIKPKKINIVKLVNEFLQTHKDIAERRNVSMKFNTKHAKLYVMADEKRLNQALINLFNNSIESMPKGGIFSVKINTKGSFVSIDIEDTGTGIQKHLIDKVFDPFFTTRETGTGLGLYITKSIIQHHKGKIFVNSDGESWTKFTIELPLLRE